MNPRQPRNDALRSLSAIGAGVLLAATPHCGGQSEDRSDDSNGGSQDNRGGSGNASSGGFVGAGNSYGGSYGGSFGGSVGLPATGGTAGTCPIPQSYCWVPGELLGCAGTLDAGPDVIVYDGGPDVGIGDGGGSGAPGEAELPPSPPPNPGAGAVPDPPAGFTCPAAEPFPACVMSSNPPPGFPYVAAGWNGTHCCYTFLTCYER